MKCSSQNVITRPHQSLQFRLWDSTLVTFPYFIMIKLRAIGRCLFSVQSCRTSNYVRSVAVSWFQSDVCVMERLRKKNLLKLSVRVEVSSVESNETTAATVSCDSAPPPQRRRRRHPPPPHHVTFLSLHYRDSRQTAYQQNDRWPTVNWL